MIDIVAVSDDLIIFDAETPKAGNVLSVQLGALEYAKDFGIDIKFFIDENFQFQNESFKSYLIQRLAESHINVNSVMQTVEALVMDLTFSVGDADKHTGGLIK